MDFVFECSRGQDKSNYEIVASGVANEKDAIGRLAYEKPNFQICLRTQNAIDEYLVFERSYSL